MHLEPIAVPAKVNWNSEEIIKKVEGIVKTYQTLLESASTFKDYKDIRTALNSDLKYANDKRIRLKKKLIKDFVDFETFFKTQEKKFDYILSECKKNIDIFEDNRKKEKLQGIEGLDGFAKYQEYHTMPSQWLNKTYKLSKIEKEIESKIQDADNALKSIIATCRSNNVQATEKYVAMLKNGTPLADILVQIESDAEFLKAHKESNRFKELIDSIENSTAGPALKSNKDWQLLKNALL